MPARKKNPGLTLLRRSSGKQELSFPSHLGWAIQAAEEMGVVLDRRLTDIEHMQAERLSECKSFCLDDSISGANLCRPGFQAMVERALGDKRVSHVFIYKRDRFAPLEETSAMVQLENRLRRKDNRVRAMMLDELIERDAGTKSFRPPGDSALLGQLYWRQSSTIWCDLSLAIEGRQRPTPHAVSPVALTHRTWKATACHAGTLIIHEGDPHVERL